MAVEWTAISAAAIMFILGATSPGPSLAVVLRNTMLGGRKRGFSCAIGHGIGFGFYAVAVVFGLVALMNNYPDVYVVMQILGGGFLLYLGIGMIRSKISEDEVEDSSREGFIEGFMIAFLNPKIAVFMLAVLASVLDPSMNSDTKWVIAILGMSIDTLWYVIVALSLSNGVILSYIKQNQRVLNLITGILMICLAIWVPIRLFAIS
ncbi:MAG: LysE family translocator [Candidatus Poseidoniaceae archaeon]|nr:LysE family translocator [Candidatus Poseidoniaceae archaeon]